MGTIQKLSQSPDWVNSFVDAFSSNFQQEIEREAEVNVKTLPKVVWNDNTFYAALDSENSTADIFNEYGNVVTALKDVSSIEDIEKCLNKKVVAELVTTEQPKLTDNDIKKSRLERSLSKVTKSSLDDELPNIAKQLGLSANASIQDVEKSVMQKLAEEGQNDQSTTDQTVQSNQSADTNQQESSQADIANESITTAKIYPNKMLVAKLQKMEKQVKKTQNELTFYKKNFTKLAQSFDQLSSIVNNLAESMYARRDPGNIYDISAEQAEVNHFNETAQRSAREIAIEHSVDLTTSQGRASLQDRILQDIDTIKLPEETLSEPAVVTPLTNVIQPVQQQVKVEISIPDQSDNVEIVDDKNTSKEKIKSTDENLAELEIPDEEDIEVRKLSDKAASLFKKQICPNCHSKSLRLGMKTASVQDVNCKQCDSHFGVNLNNEDIFIK